MFYLSDISRCCFCRHAASVKTGTILKGLRGFKTPVGYDIIIIEALIELRNVLPYGPYSLSVTSVDKIEILKLCLNDDIMLVAEREGDDYCLIYIREQDMSWAEEFCKIAHIYALNSV